MRSTLALGILLLLSASTSAQTYVENEIILADRGNAQNGSDGGVRRYTMTGNLLGSLPAAGSGATRGVGVDVAGNIWIARGNDIIMYAAPSYAAGNVIVSGVKAQDVAIHPVTGNVWCSFGASAMEAQVLEVTPAGTVVQTLTDSLLEHPRRLVFGSGNDDLFIANVVDQNVLHLDTATGTFQVHVDLSAAMTAPIAVAHSPVTPNRLYVTSDYGTANTIFQIDGAPGAGVSSTYLSYSGLTDLNAPAGLAADSYGNVFVANRDVMGSVAGVYCLRDGGLRPIQPFTGTEQVNPIDVAFVRRQLDLTLSSSDGVDPNGNAQILFGLHQAVIDVTIQAPDYPSTPYGIFWCSYAGTAFEPLCTGATPPGPVGAGLQVDPADPRFVPIVIDNTFLNGLLILQNGGSGVLPAADPAMCPGGSVAGSFTFMGGVTDPTGTAAAQIVFPSLPCVPPVALTLPMGLIVAIVDGNVAPSQVGLISAAPTCLNIRQP